MLAGDCSTMLLFCFTQKLLFVLGCPSTVTKNGYCCVFPFKYKGKTYDSCTFVGGSKPWCALTSDYDADGKYGYCAKQSTFI